MNLDCVGNTGKLEVNFSAAGGAGIQCTDAANTEGGRVGLSGDGSLLPRNQTITITGPNDQPWSVAIDAGAKVTGN